MEHTVSVNSKAVETQWGWQVYTRMMNGGGFIPQGSPHKTLELAIADCKDFDAPPPPGPMRTATLELSDNTRHWHIRIDGHLVGIGHEREGSALYDEIKDDGDKLNALYGIMKDHPNECGLCQRYISEHTIKPLCQ